MDELEIICMYNSREYGKAWFNTLIDSYQNYDGFTPADFISVDGGLRINQGHKTLFYSDNFYFLINPVSFLLHSLYWVQGRDSGIWDSFEQKDLPCGIAVHMMTSPREYLILSRKDKEYLLLSYLPSGNKVEKKRGIHYFENEPIKESAWVEAAKVALAEYFLFFEKAMDKDRSHPGIEIMEKYLRAWQNIR